MLSFFSFKDDRNGFYLIEYSPEFKWSVDHISLSKHRSYKLSFEKKRVNLIEIYDPNNMTSSEDYEMMNSGYDCAKCASVLSLAPFHKIDNLENICDGKVIYILVEASITTIEFKKRLYYLRGCKNDIVKIKAIFYNMEDAKSFYRSKLRV